MTTDTLAETSNPDRTLPAVTLLAALSGGALVVDTVTIAVINRSFDPLDSILFLTGFAGLWLTVLGLAVHLSAGRRGAARVVTAAGIFVAVAVVLGAISAACDQVGRHAFGPSNIGLHGEWSFFSIGVCLLLIAAWGNRRRRAQNADGRS